MAVVKRGKHGGRYSFFFVIIFYYQNIETMHNIKVSFETTLPLKEGDLYSSIVKHRRVTKL